MKKFISIILAVIIAFSAITVGVSAYTMENEGVWISCEGNVVHTNPGDTKTFPISVAAKLTEEDSKEIDAATSYIEIPFTIKTNEMSPMKGVELTDAAKKANVTFEQETTEESFVSGKLKVPFTALNGNNSLEVLNVTVKMDEKWEVENYKAKTPVIVQICEGVGSVKIYDAEGDISVKLLTEEITINAVPYKPNFFERAIEWIKQKLLMIPVLFRTLNAYLLSDPLKAPKWQIGLNRREIQDKIESGELPDTTPLPKWS